MIKKPIKLKLSEYFYLNPTAKLRVREIERKVKIPLPSAIKYSKELKEANILKITKISNITLYSANITSEEYKLQKKLFNIKQIHKSGLINQLKEKLSNPTIILFGSFSRGEDLEKSDIDIYIETPSKVKLNLQKFEKILNKKIQIFQNKSLKELKNKDLANNIINGIVLNGFIDVFK